jgi:predicted GIY-YIG superfamily endonuclease
MEASRNWFCYMVRCSDGSLYVGIAADVTERVKRHNWGAGPGFTAKRRPVQLIWSECCGSAEVARRREKEIKGWSRDKKLSLLVPVARERWNYGKGAARGVRRSAGLP